MQTYTCDHRKKVLLSHTLMARISVKLQHTHNIKYFINNNNNYNDNENSLWV